MSTFDLIILILFAAGSLMGFRRGFILQAVHLLGFFIAYLVAHRYFDQFSPFLQSWIPYPFEDHQVNQPFIKRLIDTEKMFYSALSFALLFFGTKFGLQIIGNLLHMIALLPGLNLANRTLGGLLGFIEVFIIVFIIVHVLGFLPWETGQDWLNHSTVAMWITESTPSITNHIQELWDPQEQPNTTQ
jgi:uncharacterized membrane protein required for colicin V production